jgi:hypothetical protein
MKNLKSKSPDNVPFRVLSIKVFIKVNYNGLQMSQIHHFCELKESSFCFCKQYLFCTCVHRSPYSQTEGRRETWNSIGT